MRLVLAFLVALTTACSAANTADTSGSGGGTGTSSGSGMGGASTTAGTGGGVTVGTGGSLTVGSTSASSSGIPDGGAACANELDLAGCPCGAAGMTRACYTGPSKTEHVGTCKPGTQTCGGSGEVATWGACTGDVIPAAENCAGSVDTNCNGLVGCADPACVGLAGCCTAGTTRPCYTGPNGTEGVGPCHGGTQLCSANGSYGPCMGEVLPGTEIGHCTDGIDNDCNGLTDCQDLVCWLDPACLPKTCTPNATQPCYTGPSGTEGVGPCHGGTQTCASNGQSWGPCTGEVLPAPEGGHCMDGVDNDCNGLVDCADPACATASNCCTTGGPPTSTLWANDPDTLYRIDPTTFAVTTVGSFGIADQMTDVAVTPTGQLYGVSFTTLYAIDMGTGAATAVADVASSGDNSLTFLPSGKLLAADSSGNVQIIDPSTGATTTVGNYGSGLVSAGDLVAVGSGIMYGTSSTTAGGADASTNNVLVRVDTSTGVATPVGPTGYGDVWGLAYSNARVIGFTTSGQIVKIDPQTGAGTLLAQTGIMFWGAGQSPLVGDNTCP
jgi:hypothetical protein